MSLASLLTSAAFAPIDNVGWIRVTGEDRVRWLNGMVTNSIQTLKPGEGCYNFFLNAQGRIQGDATAWMMEDSILLETAADRVPALMAMLEHFIIMDDVELTLGRAGSGLFLGGPTAPEILKATGHQVPSQPLRRVFREDTGFTLFRIDDPLIPHFELWSTGPQDFLALASAVRDRGASLATEIELEQFRILEGTPLYGVDIRDKDLPQETNQTRALHFSKGCYLGQEIVERIRSRGNVHRTFSGFVLEGELPAAGTLLTADERPVGELTSITRIQWPSGPVQLALGYIRREIVERGATIHYPGGTATPSKLPFSLPESRA